MDLDEVEVRVLVEHSLVVRLAQPDADARSGPIGCTGCGEGLRRHVRPFYFLVASATWASSAVRPPSCLQVPLAT